MTAKRLIFKFGVILGLVMATTLVSASDDLLVEAEQEVLVPSTETFSDGTFSNELSGYSAWDDAFETTTREAVSDIDLPEAVSVPEPSAIGLSAVLAALLLAMTLLRWHFDHSKLAPAVSKESRS